MRIFSILKIIVWLWLIIKIVVFVWCVTVVTHCKCGLEFLDLNNMDNWFCFGMYLDKKTSFKRLFLFWSFFCCFSCCFFSCCFSCGFFLCCHYSNNIPHGFLLIKLTKIYKTSIIWITFFLDFNIFKFTIDGKKLWKVQNLQDATTRETNLK